MIGDEFESLCSHSMGQKTRSAHAPGPCFIGLDARIDSSGIGLINIQQRIFCSSKAGNTR